VRIEVTRRGGIAGVTLKAEVDTGDLPPDDATRVERSVKQLIEACDPGRAPPIPDSFEYHISLPDHPDRPTVVVPEHEVPDHLRPLIQAAKTRARLEER